MSPCNLSMHNAVFFSKSSLADDNAKYPVLELISFPYTEYNDFKRMFLASNKRSSNNGNNDDVSPYKNKK